MTFAQVTLERHLNGGASRSSTPPIIAQTAATDIYLIGGVKRIAPGSEWVFVGVGRGHVSSSQTTHQDMMD